jgi:hypothetical protein
MRKGGALYLRHEFVGEVIKETIRYFVYTVSYVSGEFMWPLTSAYDSDFSL